MTFLLTPEQEAILQVTQGTSDSLMIHADAGCGKTSALVLVAQALPRVPTLAVAFNKKNVKDLEKRISLPHIKVLSLNGLGHTAWGRTLQKPLTLDDRKIGRLIRQESNGDTDLDRLLRKNDNLPAVIALVNAGRTAGIIPKKYPHKPLLADTLENWASLAEDDLPEVLVSLAQTVLLKSCQEAFRGIIDYDDQIFCSALFKANFPRYSTVLGDEAQDFSVLNRIMLSRINASRFFLFGDSKQSIYAFRGADGDSMANLRSLATSWQDLPLHVTFRCPKVIVARQQGHAPGFRAHPDAPEGRVLDLRRYSDGEAVPWTWADIEDGMPKDARGLFVLCRNNAPLFSMAFRLLRLGVGVTMLGTDIGKGLATLLKKIIPMDDMPKEDCIRLIRQWHEIQEPKSEKLADKVESLLAVLEASGAETAGAARRHLGEMFSKDSPIKLGTIHKMKGAEEDCVLHLDPWRIPSKFAKSEVELKQEANARYIADTRTRHTLILANMDTFDHSRRRPSA